MNQINLVVWTLGEHAQRNILPALQGMTEILLYGIYTRNKLVGEKVAAEYDVKVYSTEQDFLQDERINAVYISSPNSLHFKQVLLCLKYNKHVIVEKSAFLSKAEADKAIEFAQDKGLYVMEAFMYKHHKQFAKLSNIIDSKIYGDVISATSSFGFPHLSKDNIRYQSSLGGGALSDAGAYTISSVLALFGEELEILGSNVGYHPNHNVDLNGAALLRTRSSNIICKWAFGGSYNNRIEIWCERAHLIVDRAFSKPPTFDSSIQVFNNGVLIENIELGPDNHFKNMFESFAEIINSDSYDMSIISKQCYLLDRIRCGF